MYFADFGMTESEIVSDPSILSHPAMLPRDIVEADLPKPVSEMHELEFADFARTHLRWYLESYCYFRPSGVDDREPRPLELTPHQLKLHEQFVKGWFVEQTQTIIVVGKHRRAYVTTYFSALIWALTRLYPGLNAMISANSWDTTEFIRDEMVMVFEDNLPPKGIKEKNRPFNIPRESSDSASQLQWSRIWEEKEVDPETHERKTVIRYSNKGGSYIMFKSAGSKEGGVSREMAAQLFSEAGIASHGVDWKLVSKRSANALPKQGPSLLVYEGTGEEHGSFINEMIDLAMSPDSDYKFVFLKWYDDPAMWLKLTSGQKITATGRTQKDKDRDLLEIERITKQFREDHNYGEQTPARRDKLDRQLMAALNWRQRVALPRLKLNIIDFNTDFPTTREDMQPVSKDTIFDRYMLEDMKEKAIRAAREIEDLPDDEKPLYPRILPIEATGGKILYTTHLLREPGEPARRLVVVDGSEGVPGADMNSVIVARFDRRGKVTIEAVHNGYADEVTIAKIAFLLSDIYRTSGGAMAPISVEDEKYGRSILKNISEMRTEEGHRPPLYRMKSAIPGQKGRRNLGFDMNPATRNFGIAYLRAWFPQWECDFIPIIDQMGHFGVTASGKIKGVSLYPDDLVLCLIQIAYIGVEWGYFAPPKAITLDGETVVSRAVPDAPEIDFDAMLKEQFPELGPNIRRAMIDSGMVTAGQEEEKPPPKPLTQRDIFLRSLQEQSEEDEYPSEPFGDLYSCLEGIL